MTNLARLSAYNGDELTVVVETPKGSQNKYVYDPGLNAFELRGVLPAGAVFPFDFGFVPSTLVDDGDPVDVLVLMDSPAFAGCIVRCRLIGVIHAEQIERGETLRNDRLIAVAVKSLTHKSLEDLSDVNEDLVSQIEHFFGSYNSAKGKTFKPIGRSGRERAQELVQVAIERATK